MLSADMFDLNCVLVMPGFTNLCSDNDNAIFKLSNNTLASLILLDIISEVLLV